MFERGLVPEEVVFTIESGEMVKDYPDDQPFPSRLLLGFPKGRPVHVVLSFDPLSRRCHVITAYVPDKKIWNLDFRSRRQT
ncbi:MAG: DUF4258 domain-containing protein [Magnetococcales bacterium]|nr:DUF4258 domain-containing protein [Magnetococcales bacterium]